MSSLHIGIIGGGAIGLLVAAYARKAGFTVTLFTRTIEQENHLHENGLTLKLSENKSVHFAVNATTSYAKMAEIDFLFVAVKQYDLREVIQKLKSVKRGNLPIAFLQNGMGHLSLLEELKEQNVFVAIVEHGALRENDTTVVHTGKGQIMIGSFNGEMTSYLPLFEQLNDSGLNVTVNEEWKEIMQNKLIANVCINPLTAIFKVQNGQLIQNPYFNKIMRKTFLEALQVLQLEKNEQTLWDYVTSICEKTRENRSSMLRDIEQNKETEIDAICGYLLDEAKKQNIKLSLIPFLYDSIKGLEIERR